MDSLRSIFLDDSGNGPVRAATVANSSDGIGGELTEDEPKWYGFGYEGLPAAEVGFALASPVLRMQEGFRKVTVTLTLSGVDATQLNKGVLAEAFDVTITGQEGWLGPYTVAPTLSSDGVLVFFFRMADTEKSVIDYDAAIHGKAYTAEAPVIQVLLKTSTSKIGYNNFKGVTLEKAKIAVDVSGMTSLNLESDAGTLDATKAFQPFGSEPAIGSRFMIGCEEALSKKLAQLTINVRWQGVPDEGFKTLYTGYANAPVSNWYFKANVVFQDSGGWDVSYDATLFRETDPPTETTFTFPPETTTLSELSFLLDNPTASWITTSATTTNKSVPTSSLSGYYTTFCIPTTGKGTQRRCSNLAKAPTRRSPFSMNHTRQQSRKSRFRTRPNPMKWISLRPRWRISLIPISSSFTSAVLGKCGEARLPAGPGWFSSGQKCSIAPGL